MYIANMTGIELDLCIRNGTIVSSHKTEIADIGIKNKKIVVVSSKITAAAKHTVDAKGLHVLPGIIDSQVHFREPGLTHKEDLESGTRGAVLGGVTTIFEMPNTNPNTVTQEDLEQKISLAQNRAWSNFAFFIGASAVNVSQLSVLEKLSGCVGVKIFMGSSTGSLLVSDDQTLEKVLRSGSRRIAIHAEDEFRLQERKKLIPTGATASYHPVWRDEESALLATKRIVAIAKKTGRKIHVLHITSKSEVEYLKEMKSSNLISVEVTPQHLTLTAPECYEKLGSLAQMNPPIRVASHRDALWNAITNGTIDVIGSDHAPHTREEKALPYPQSPSGMTGVQTLVPIMLNHINEGRLSLQQFVQLASENPAAIYGAKSKGKIAVNFDADLTIVDLKKSRVIEDSWIASKCGWSPFAGYKVVGWPTHTVVMGALAMQNDTLVNRPHGEVVEFYNDLK